MLNKFFIFTFITILWGCSPKYKIVYDYIPPQNFSAKEGIKSCYTDLKKCNKRCQAKNESCAKKAYALAKLEYLKEISLYKTKLLNYQLKYKDYLHKKNNKDDLEERYNYYHDVCNTKKDRYACQKANFYLDKLNNLKYLQKPYKPSEPNFDDILSSKKSSLCSNNCNCKEEFNSCYVSYGGVVKTKKICIANCPDD